MIEDMEFKLDEKDKFSSSLEKQLEALAEVFSYLGLELSNLNDAVTKVVSAGSVELANPSESLLSIPLQVLSNLLKDVQSDSSSCQNSQHVQDKLKSLVDNISSNIINIINHLINTIAREAELKGEIEKCVQENFKDQLVKQYEEVKIENEETKKNCRSLFENSKENLKELTSIKEKIIILEAWNKQKENKIDELERSNFNLKRRVNTHPTLPYINFEKKMFNKMIETHDCICHICGEGINQPASKKEDEDVVMANAEINSIVPSSTNETVISLTLENERLKQRLVELHEVLEKLKVETTLTEDKLVNSKPFKVLVSQAEQLLQLIDSLKEANAELQRQKSDAAREKEYEIKSVEQRYQERIHELERIILEQRKILEKDKIVISDGQLRIQGLENELKLKLEEDINGIFGNFENERQNSLKQMEIIKSQMKDYERKFDEEFKKTRIFEERIEAMELGSNVSITLTQPEVIAHMEKRILKRNDQIRRLENELKSEREYKDAFISELEVNEKGLNDINKKTKALSNQLSACNDKIAKMTSDRMKDSEIIKRLNEEKNSQERLVKGLEQKNKLESEVHAKLTQDIFSFKEIISRLELDVKLKEEDIEALKNETLRAEKLGEQNRIAYEKSLGLIRDLETALAKQATNCDSMKIKYEELCKIKNIDGSQIGKSISELEYEVEGLSAILSKYKVRE
jgi:hypothetical protein